MAIQKLHLAFGEIPLLLGVVRHVLCSCMCCSALSPVTQCDTTRVRACTPGYASQARKVRSLCNSPTSMGPCRIAVRVLNSWALTLIDFLSWDVVHQCAW